jgi:hypothetical protein
MVLFATSFRSTWPASRIRTGGSADNAPIMAANATLGFVIDEHWVTLQPAR